MNTALGAVPLPKRCAKVPSRLELAPADSNLGKTLAARWTKSAGGSGDGTALACALTAAKGEADGLGLKMTTLIVNLNCGGRVHRGETAWSGGMMRGDPVDKLTAQLVRSIAAQACAKQRMPIPSVRPPVELGNPDT